ncbi:MAG: response regulator transcription factor [Chloroflexi bacterium]|nr:response regulator transcription factor [Chloroflexota bacterium]MBK7917943.1 response regulator transcription factor [Chloroflexota bacterium]MBP6802762.1 response regulator transcription factor [Chloroflexota bacterium]MBP7590983.1 response regulator transcription factor [Chloroflexota bacterium]
MSIKVFLADDHKVVRDGLHLLLSAEADIEVVGGASNGLEAIDLVAQLRPDVVVMDIAMPGMNGIEAMAQILRANPAIKVIFLSMHATKEYIFQALQAGARGYLLKESAGIEVVNAVRMVYLGGSYLSPKISNQVIEGYVRPKDDDADIDPLSALSPRERQIFRLVVEGKSSAEIAKMLFLSPKTVDTYRSRLMQKLGVSDLLSLFKFAVQHKLMPLDS